MGTADIASTTAPAIMTFFINQASSALVAEKSVASAVPRTATSAIKADAESVDDRVDDGEESDQQAEDRPEHVVAALARQRVEERRDGVAAGEAAGVGVVVDAADGEPHHHEHERVLNGVRVNHAASALPPVMEHGA